MLKFDYLSFLLLSSAFASTLHGVAVSLSDLRCEYLEDPVGIDVVEPRFSWKLDAAEPVRGLKQTAYRILVASSAAALEAGEADLWDSGRVESDQSHLVAYAGRSLQSSQRGFWKVRVWTSEDAKPIWSPVAQFSMGLMEPEDWQGPWIFHPPLQVEGFDEARIANQHYWYRRNFELPQSPESAVIHVASLGYHELHINGVKVDDRVLAPAQSRLDKRVLYVTYEIADFLKAGRNTIGIHFGPGWSRYSFYKMRPGLRVQLNANMQAGKLFSLSTDTQWRAAPAASANTGGCQYRDNGGEELDGRLLRPDWSTTSFDDSEWTETVEVPIDVTLSAQMMAPSRIIESFPAQSITHLGQSEAGEDIYRVIFEKNFTGYFEMELRGQQAGDRIRISVNDDDPARKDNFHQISRYICHGQGEERFRHRFNFCAGRYFTITGLREKPKLSDFTGHAISTDLERVGEFSSSNPLFNQIYETDLWTLLANTTEGYTSDCPHRERLGYGEVQWATTWGITLPNFEVGAYLSKHARDWMDVQEDNGWIHHTAPQINRHYGGPLWSSAGFNLTRAFYDHHGDERALAQNYDSAKRWLEFLHGNTSEGLLQNFGDWGRYLGDWAAPGGRKEGGGSPEADFFNNCVYAMNLMNFIKSAQVLGHHEDAALYQARLEPLRKAIHKQFYNAESGLYANGTQVQQAFALLTEVCPPEMRRELDAKIAADIKDRGYLDMGSSGLPVLLKFMIEQSAYPEVLSLPLNRTTIPSYGFFIKSGQTAWPEYWEPRTSNIHTCYTGIASWFTKSLAGIRPDPEHPGFQKFLIEPVHPDGLTHARAATKSPYGRILSSWKIEDGRYTHEALVPPNSRATLRIPCSDPDRIREGEIAVLQAEGVRLQSRTEKHSSYILEPGHYRFSCPAPIMTPAF